MNESRWTNRRNVIHRTRRNAAVAIVRLVSLGFVVVLQLPDWATSTRQGQLGTPMHKVEFTQKGYIQFLRWELPVPEFTEFTFCLWMKSNDLTHSHPIFSYSRNERERLVRSWIAPRGGSVHLEIGGKQVLAVASDIRENRWYHICLSWESEAGRYGLWVDGRLWARGRSVETIGHTIPSGGDMVLGQEYTDFDKGLDDGIEGSVVGFNLLLASAFDASNHHLEATYDTSHAAVSHFLERIPTKLTHGADDRATIQLDSAFSPISNERRGRRYTENAVSYPALIFVSPRTEEAMVDDRDAVNAMKLAEWEEEPPGLRLIKLSYVRCEIGRGSPFIAGGSMLISWTRTPVRVFGGAILKNVEGTCGHF